MSGADARTPAGPETSLPQQLCAEFLGTALLLCAVIGSGIMAERLSGGNVAVALLANTLATVFALYVLIETLGPISGAHFNPVVTLVLMPKQAQVHVQWTFLAILFIASSCWVRSVAPGWPTPCSASTCSSSAPRCALGRHSGWLRAWPPPACCLSSCAVVGMRGCTGKPARWWPATSRGLLVHRQHQLCQPGGGGGPHAERQFCRHRAGQRTGFSAGATGGRRGRCGGGTLARTRTGWRKLIRLQPLAGASAAPPSWPPARAESRRWQSPATSQWAV